MQSGALTKLFKNLIPHFFFNSFLSCLLGMTQGRAIVKQLEFCITAS